MNSFYGFPISRKSEESLRKNLSWRTDRRMGSNWDRLTTEPSLLMVVMGAVKLVSGLSLHQYADYSQTCSCHPRITTTTLSCM